MSLSPCAMGASDPGHLVWTPTPRVSALSTTRLGGYSQGPWGRADGQPGGLNLGAHVGDSPTEVAANRARLHALVGVPILWMEQLHGIEVFDADVDAAPGSGDALASCSPHLVPRADAAVCTRPGRALCVMTADCLPVLLSDEQGRCIGAAHAGWRGLQGGVLEATVRAMRHRLPDQSELLAWLGPAIGPRAFEVGEEVREAFMRHDARAAESFRATGQPGKWWADLFLLARQRLADCGVSQVTGGGVCTFEDPRRFYSHRRDRLTGRMASLIWIGA